MITNDCSERLTARLAEMPLVAILRGIEVHEVIATCTTLVEAGFRVIEIPLNSPRAFESIKIAAAAFGESTTIGAGTVLTPAAVSEVAAAGGELIVMPHGDCAVISAVVAAELAVAPGVATPTEAFAALAAGAHALKLFPAEVLGVKTLKAWGAVLPPATPLIPVGGVTPQTLAEFHAAGAAGYGIGSALYQPGMSVADVRTRANAFVSAVRALN